MYNRYIPQSDGSYRRSSVPEPPANSPRPTPQSSPAPPAAPQCQPPCPPPPRPSQRPVCRSCHKPAPPPATGIGSFLKQLIPGQLDTGDLLVVILLLLISTDSREDQGCALLTLALYLFL